MVAIIEPAKSGGYDEDAALLERYLAGDESAFARLYNRYSQKVYTIARAILLDHDEAADATQIVFTHVLQNAHKYDNRAKFGTWLHRVTVNRCIQYSRRIKFRKRQVALDSVEDGGLAVAETTQGDPTVDAALARVRPEDRAVLSMFYWEDWSLREIADALGCSENAAKTRLFRARERFREAYEGAQ